MLLHGQLRPREKAEAMERFAAGKADVLVATTVIEVGIDVPNATVMLVEDAERYGISQLHQLRGRVGRGEHASLCLLFGPKDSRAAASARPARRRVRAGRDRPRAARGGRAHRHAPVAAWRASGSPGCPRTRRCSSGPTRARAELLRADPELAAPSTRCWPTRSPAPTARPEALAADPGDEGRSPARYGGRRLAAPPRARHAPDERPRARGAVLDARPARRRARARPVRRARARSAIEALSRGAARATFVDARAARSRRSARTSRRSGSDAAEVRRRGRAARSCATHARAATTYDLVFLDPPYRLAAGAGPRARGGAGRRCSRPAARVVSESDRRAPLDARAARSTDERRYGDTLIRIHTA